ncbi:MULTISPECIES: hypothetical protein [Arthrobacter]|nr:MULTISPECIES: hypothetical protein [Arthrobacter]
MRQMGNSGKLAIIAAVVSAGLLVLLAITLEESVMYMLLAVLAIGYLACIAEVFVRRRYLMMVLGAVASTLFVAFGIAFLRMWGLAFNQDENSMGSAVSTKDSDIYFYLAVVAGCSALLVLFLGAVWPSRRAVAKKRPTPASRPAARPAARGGQRPASNAPRTVQRPVPRANQATVQRPTQRKPAPAAKRPTSGSPSSQRKAAPKR